MPLGCVSFSRKSQNLFIFFLLKKVQLGIGCCFYLKIMDAGLPIGGDLW
jgi:hypothetical protein